MKLIINSGIFHYILLDKHFMYVSLILKNDIRGSVLLSFLKHIGIGLLWLQDLFTALHASLRMYGLY